MEAVRILIVDDEIALTRLMETLLRRRGFEVVSTTSSRDALHCFEQTQPAFHLVIADMSMPELSGGDLLRKILHSNGSVRGILCSGYCGVAIALEKEFPGRIYFLQKPFPPGMLTDAVDRLIGQEPGRGSSHSASSSAT